MHTMTASALVEGDVINLFFGHRRVPATVESVTKSASDVLGPDAITVQTTFGTFHPDWDDAVEIAVFAPVRVARPTEPTRTIAETLAACTCGGRESCRLSCPVHGLT